MCAGLRNVVETEETILQWESVVSSVATRSDGQHARLGNAVGHPRPQFGRRISLRSATRISSGIHPENWLPARWSTES